MTGPKLCKKCGSSERPTAKYLKAFDAAICKAGSCPNDEHLHLTCACGFAGIAPCADAKELGEPYTPPAHGNLTDAARDNYDKLFGRTTLLDECGTITTDDDGNKITTN